MMPFTSSSDIVVFWWVTGPQFGAPSGSVEIKSFCSLRWKCIEGQAGFVALLQYHYIYIYITLRFVEDESCWPWGYLGYGSDSL